MEFDFLCFKIEETTQIDIKLHMIILTTQLQTTTGYDFVCIIVYLRILL